MIPGLDVHIVSKQTSGMLPALLPGVEVIKEDIEASGVELARPIFERLKGGAPEVLQTLARPYLVSR